MRLRLLRIPRETRASPVNSVLILHPYDRLSPRVEQEIIALCAAGYRIHVMSWARAQETGSYKPREGVTLEAIQFPAPKGTLRLLFYLPRLYSQLRRNLKGRAYDIVHCTHVMLLPFAVFWGRRHKAKIVYDVYEFHLEEIAEKLPRPLRWAIPLLRRLESVLVRRTNGVLTVDSKDGWLEHHYRRYSNNVAVLYNVPDINFSLNPEKIQQLGNRYQDRSVVLYVGGLSREKGAIQAIEIAKRVAQRAPESLFLFIGAFQGKTEEAFWDRIHAQGLQGNVEFISWLPYNEMLHYVAISKVGLILHQPTARYHLLGKGNGRKAFTYMQLGIPIVAPEFGEVGQVVREELCGILVNTLNPQEVADAIVHLLGNPSEARVLGERGRKAILEKYNWGIEQRELMAVYEKL